MLESLQPAADAKHPFENGAVNDGRLDCRNLRDDFGQVKQPMGWAGTGGIPQLLHDTARMRTKRTKRKQDKECYLALMFGMNENGDQLIEIWLHGQV
jgi:hypothetical protein